MQRYLIQRIGGVAVTIAVVVTIAFVMVRLAPGDPVQVLLGEFYSPEAERALRRRYGLDRPLYVQYGIFALAVVQGDLGTSLRDQQPVTRQIARTLPYTLHLAAGAVVVALLIGVPLGVQAALHRGRWKDFAAMLVAVLGRSMPSFWLALLAIYLFSFRLGLFPAFGTGAGGARDALRALVLPALVLGIDQAAFLARLIRSGLLEVLNHEYVRVARAKGLRERAVVYRHALRNAMLPVVTQMGLMVGRLLGGAVVVERVFTRAGMGQLLVDSVTSRDYPVIQGVVLCFGALFVATNLTVDLLYGLWDPRVRYV
jgi:ABC-type dipeptide/oligopeptide/nickel transport system permease component